MTDIPQAMESPVPLRDFMVSPGFAGAAAVVAALIVLCAVLYAARRAGKRLKEELEKHEVFQSLKKNVTIQVTPEGLRIILNESEDSPAFFEPGSAKLLQQSAIILVTIAQELGKLPNHIVIEGHTSETQVSTGAYTNWELSADRANAAVRGATGLQTP